MTCERPITQASPRKRGARFRALFSLADSDQLEMIMGDYRSHLPRRIALTALAHDSERLMRCYGSSSDGVQMLADDVENLTGYLASQHEFLEMVATARDRLAALQTRVAATLANPRIRSNTYAGDPLGTYRGSRLMQWHPAGERPGEAAGENSEIS